MVSSMVKRYAINQKNIAQFTCLDGRKDTLYFLDGERGLALRCSAGGGRSWVFQYVSPITGHDRRVALGKTDAVPVSVAKARAQELRGIIASGRCPHYEEQERLRIEAAPKPPTVSQAIEIHSERLFRDLKQPEQRIRQLKQDLQPLFGHLIKDVTRREWVDLFEKVAKRAPYAANRLQAAVSAMYSDLCDRGILELHPLLRLKKRTKEVARDRVFSLDELKRCWLLASSDAPTKSADQFRHLIGLLALTGCRREEIAAMSWNEVDMERRLFNLPAARSKTKVGRTIPLCDQAIRILEQRTRLPEGDFVFGDATLGRSSFSGFSKAWSMFRKEAGIPDDLRIHDLRRTFSTYADEHVEASIPVIEAFLGHLSGTRSGIVSVYNRANYFRCTKMLAQSYGDFLDSLITI
jgi:integrase